MAFSQKMALPRKVVNISELSYRLSCQLKTEHKVYSTFNFDKFEIIDNVVTLYGIKRNLFSFINDFNLLCRTQLDKVYVEITVPALLQTPFTILNRFLVNCQPEVAGFVELVDVDEDTQAELDYDTFTFYGKDEYELEFIYNEYNCKLGVAN